MVFSHFAFCQLDESDLSDDGEASLGGEEDNDDEDKATPQRSRPRRSGIGLRVALQFPTKKPAKKSDKNSCSEPLFSSSHLQDNTRAVLGRKKSCRQGQEREDSASEPESDSRDEGQEGSDALLKRTMNIKENKAMVRPRPRPGSWHRGAQPVCAVGALGLVSGRVFWVLCVLSVFLNPRQLQPASSGLGADSQHLF